MWKCFFSLLFGAVCAVKNCECKNYFADVQRPNMLITWNFFLFRSWLPRSECVKWKYSNLLFFLTLGRAFQTFRTPFYWPHSMWECIQFIFRENDNRFHLFLLYIFRNIKLYNDCQYGQQVFHWQTFQIGEWERFR